MKNTRNPCIVITLCIAYTNVALSFDRAAKSATASTREPNAAAPQPLSIGSERQLFVDDFLVEAMDGTTVTLHEPTKHPSNPLVERSPAELNRWDAGMPLSFSSVLYDEREQIFKMWYSLHAGSGGDANSVLCFATSRDGLRWFKPALGLFEYRDSKKNNIVMPHSGLASGVFEDRRESDPAKRFKMVHMWRDYKVYASYSADGIRWTAYKGGEPVFFTPPGHDSQMVAYWDEKLAKYVAIIRDRTGRIRDVRPELVSNSAARESWRRLWDPEKNRAPENHSIRRVAQIESTDFVHWTNYRVIVGPDAHDPLNRDQFYNLEVFPYEGVRLGLTTVFSYDPDFCRGAVQLVCSRDGRTWQRVGQRQTFLPLSSRAGDFDWGGIYPLQGPVEHNDEIWIYYNGYGVDHNHKPPPGLDGFPNGIGLAKLRLDGFVSIDGGETEGSLTTRLIEFAGERLRINATTAEFGHVLVEALDAAGQPIAGFTKKDCDPFTGDALRHVVSWKGSADVSRLEAHAVKLKFYLRSAQLYSFSFPAGGGTHQAEVEIEKRVEIVPGGVLRRAMMSLVRHPSGAIYLNTQTGPLYESTDDGETWTPVPVQLDGVPQQTLVGLGVTRRGRLLLVHQTPGHDPSDARLYGQDLYVSYSDDRGRTWTRSHTDFRRFAPGIPNMKFHEDGGRTFVEQPGGALMFATTIVPAEDYVKKHAPTTPPTAPNYLYGGTTADTFGDVVFRSTDDGETWGDPTRVYTKLNPHESTLALDPHNANRLIECARIQRGVGPGEDAAEMMWRTGNPSPTYKQAALFESVDGGRTFRLLPGGMTDWYGHRGSILWTKRDVVVLTHNAGAGDSRVLARISLDGARHWVDGTKVGTPLMSRSTKFTLAPSHSFISPTIELRQRNRFLTTYCVEGFAVRGVFWKLRTTAAEPGRSTPPRK